MLPQNYHAQPTYLGPIEISRIAIVTALTTGFLIESMIP